ncbi:acetyltransferase [Pedobacter panaciterrae]|uniref:acetyltransferase n=1 Tax=Pedobacter panaciterrae TaxID=363849 RepID=UPI00155DB938|nr:acetyltransferase [Pedobacter panaciterrae]NQX55256.1 acetyltransferase [Pedobacter panaciterrae]
MKKEAVVIGYSGHAYVVADLLLKNKISLAGYCEKQKKTANPFNVDYLGDESNSEVVEELKSFNVYLGIGDNKVRDRLYQYLRNNDISLPLLKHPKAIVSKYSEIGTASVVMAGAIINAISKIGKGVILNTSCIVEHECLIGDFAHIGPGAVLAGNVNVGDFTFIGANSVIKQNIRIGKNVIVGAGSVIVKNIPDNVTVYGNPARIK